MSQPLKLNHIPKMPKGYEKYQGQTLAYFAAVVSPMSLLDAMKKGGWELDEQAKRDLFPSQATVKRPSRHF